MKILITGASSGIGFSLAKELSRRKHTVYITTHTEKQRRTVNEKIKMEKLNILAFKMDITNKDDRSLIDKIDIDCLVSHAGIGEGGSILDIDIDVLRKNYETNVFSNFAIIQEFYQKKLKGGGRAKIFVTSSLAAVLPIPYLGCYTSSKAAIIMLAMTIKKELKDKNIKNMTISLIEPGAYNTGFNRVMIDNKEINLEGTDISSQEIYNINGKQRKLFSLIEKDNTRSIVMKVCREIEKKNPHFKIKAPFFQALFYKLYLLFFW